MKTEDIDRLFDKFYKEEASRIEVPEGLEDRLSQFVDELDAREKSGSRRKIWLIAGSIAACVVIGFSTAHFFERKPANIEMLSMGSTITDPYEAYIETEKALKLMSDNLNKGLAMVNQAEAELEKSNQKIYKFLNRQK